MVGRITSGSNLSGVLQYNGQKVNRGEAVVLGGNAVIEGENPAHFDMDDALRSFEPYLALNRNTKKTVFHVSLNPDVRDNLTDEQLSAIAREYMERMGYGEQPYYIFKHRDIDREHIHIVSVRVDAEGRKIDHNFERRRSVEVLRELEQRYGLHPAPEGEERKVFDTVRKVEYGRENLTQQMRSTVRLLAEQYRFGSIHEFRTLLNLYNVDLEQRRGVAGGKPFEGIMYSATDERGKWLGAPIKASRLTPKGGIKYLQSRIDKAMTDIRDERLKAPIRNAVAQAMHAAHTKEDFVRRLKAEGIDAVLRENAGGRITGATFIDHRTRTVLNGSRLGKSYSANVFQELFNNPQADRAALLPKLAPPRPRPVLVPDAVNKILSKHLTAAAGTPHEPAGSLQQIPNDRPSGILADIVGTVFDSLGDSAPGMTPEELDAWRDRIRRKQKQKPKHTLHQ